MCKHVEAFFDNFTRDFLSTDLPKKMDLIGSKVLQKWGVKMN